MLGKNFADAERIPLASTPGLNALFVQCRRNLVVPMPDVPTGTTLMEISVCVDSDAGKSLSCGKDATGPDFLLAFSMLAGG